MRSFSIAAGDLSQALNSLAEQAGLALAFDPALTRGKSSNGLNGSFSTSQALARLLQGTGLNAIALAARGHEITVLTVVGEAAEYRTPSGVRVMRRVAGPVVPLPPPTETTLASLVRAPALSWSNSWRDTALFSSSFCARASSVTASSARDFAATSCDSARATSASNGRGSMLNSSWPRATVAPSVKWTLSTVPATRGRSSTNSAASMRPLKVSTSVTVRCTAGATLTGMAGGGPPWASARPPQADSRAVPPAANRARAKRWRMRRASRDWAGMGYSRKPLTVAPGWGVWIAGGAGGSAGKAEILTTHVKLF